MPDVALRPVADPDLDALFEMGRDPESVRMAAFTSADPADRGAFDKHMAKLRGAPTLLLRAVTVDGRLAGTVGSFPVDGDTEITYWIDRTWWGRGVATRAVELLLELVAVRPVYARAVSDNTASLRVLAKTGFRMVGTERSYAPGRGEEVEETILRLDETPRTPR